MKPNTLTSDHSLVLPGVVEYELLPAKFCPSANSPAYNFNSIRKTDDLFDLPYRPCR